MKHSIAILSIALILLSACGKEVTESKMTQAQALDTLAQANQAEAESRSAFGKKKPKVSYAELFKLIQDLIAQGKIQVPGQNRGAVSVNDLSSLTNVFGAISNSGTSSNFLTLMSLASTMISTSGSGGQAKFDINAVISILNQAAPIIATIAPQYSGLIQAMVVILPMVVTFINMFSKPTGMIYWHDFAPTKA